MKLFIFPGNSPRHKEWAESLRDFFTKDFDEIIIHYYRHWETGEPEADIDSELKNMRYADDIGECMVIAKSIGCAIFAYALNNKIITPVNSVLLGIPLKVIKEHEIPFSALIGGFSPVTVIQNSYDPLGSYMDVKKYLDNEMFVTVTEHSGDTHDYLDFELIRRVLFS